MLSLTSRLQQLRAADQDAPTLFASSLPPQHWPQGAAMQRLHPQARPSFHSSFTLEPGSEIFTIGSCFARNIEDYLLALGFEVPGACYTASPLEWSGPRPGGVLNAYTPPIIELMLELGALWHSGEASAQALALETGLISSPDGRWVDSVLAYSQPASQEVILSRRERMLRLMARSMEAQCVVITLGLIECWFDLQTGLPLGRAPYRRLRDARLEDGSPRFIYRRLRVQDVLETLTATLDKLRTRGQPGLRVMLSVSPVPLLRTFEAEDVLVANMQSKSVLRSAAGELIPTLDYADYIPSYEAVMLSMDASTWEQDRRHVAESHVASIIQGVVQKYLPQPRPQSVRLSLAVAKLLRLMRDQEEPCWPLPDALASTLEQAARHSAGQEGSAASLVRGLLSLQAGEPVPDELLQLREAEQQDFLILYCAAWALQGSGHAAECLALARRLVEQRPHDRAFRSLYRWSWRAGDSPEDMARDISYVIECRRQILMELKHSFVAGLRQALIASLPGGQPEAIARAAADLARVQPRSPLLAQLSDPLPPRLKLALLQGARQGREEAQHPLLDSTYQQLLQLRLSKVLERRVLGWLPLCVRELLESSPSAERALRSLHAELVCSDPELAEALLSSITLELKRSPSLRE